MPVLGFCFSLTPVTSMSVLSLPMIRNRLSLKMVPRFTKITGCSELLLRSISARSGSLLPPPPSRIPSLLPLLLSPWCPGQGRQLSPREGLSVPPGPPSPPRPLPWSAPEGLGGQHQGTACLPCKGGSCSSGSHNHSIWDCKLNWLCLEGVGYIATPQNVRLQTTLSLHFTQGQN